MNLSKRPRPTCGYLYAVECDGYVKVGRTYSFRQRKTAYPGRTELALHKVRDPVAAEWHVLALLREQGFTPAKGCEWFPLVAKTAALSCLAMTAEKYLPRPTDAEDARRLGSGCGRSAYGRRSSLLEPRTAGWMQMPQLHNVPVVLIRMLAEVDEACSRAGFEFARDPKNKALCQLHCTFCDLRLSYLRILTRIGQKIRGESEVKKLAVRQYRKSFDPTCFEPAKQETP